MRSENMIAEEELERAFHKAYLRACCTAWFSLGTFVGALACHLLWPR